MYTSMIPFLSAAVFLSLGALSCSSRKPLPAGEIAQRVTVRQPDRFDHPLSIRASGNVEAAQTTYLSFQVPGRVSKVHVKEGQPVRAGQPLADLDVKDYELRVSAASAQAGAARAAFQKASAGTRAQELAQAKIDLDRTADEYKRLKALYERGSLAPNDYTKIEAAWLAAKERYSLALEGARQEDRQAAKETLDAAQAQESIARKAFADTRLNAPFSGVIAMRGIESGMLVDPSRPAFILMDLDPAKIRVGVPEAEIGKVRAGQRAAIRIPSLGAHSFEGRVETIGIAADPATRTFAVKITVPNSALELRAGMIAESDIETGEKVSAITVPGQCIVRDVNGAATVYVLSPGENRVYARQVETGTVFGLEVQIVKGLSGSEKVVIAGQQLVHNGSAVAAAAQETAK